MYNHWSHYSGLCQWVEQLTLRCWYVFEHYACIKQRFFTDEKKELKDMYREDADGLLALAKHLYEVKNTKGENSKQ